MIIEPLYHHTEPAEQSWFETFIGDLSARLAGLPAATVNTAIESVQRLVCRRFGLDGCTLWERVGNEPGAFVLTHAYPHAGELTALATPQPGLFTQHNSVGDDLFVPATIERAGSAVTFPWIEQIVLTGEPVVIPRVAKLPAEGVGDRTMLVLLGIRSAVVVSLFVGGECFGCMTFATTREEREWRDEDVRRFQTIGHLVGGAIARKKVGEELRALNAQAGEDVRKSAAEWRLTVDSITHPVVLLDAGLRVVRANAAAERLAGLSGGLAGRRCATLVRCGDELVDCPLRTALASKNRAEAEIRTDDGRRWFRETAVPLVDDSGNLTGAVLAVEDITEQKLAEEKLRKSLAEVERLKDQLKAETDYLRQEIQTHEPHSVIAGESEAIRKALHQVRQVAPTDSTVLLCGETGVGKELFAEALHRLSSRKGRALVKVNCAALPQPLVESELFGREKGAYTGALAHQAGRFDVANESSIFLDEIGELSLEVQAKLLRVLQEGEFERLGSPRTVKVNVRLIAATNRDLVEEVRKGRFRQDLFYRLNVFPIKIPALRERAEDIPLLVWKFVEEFCLKMGKRITKIPRKTMEGLQSHAWPGNVRELRNVIERSIIITPGDTLRVPQLQELQQAGHSLTLADTEREHILRILEKTLWHIKGPNGAAGKLGLKPSTLYTRMQKLGIPNRRQKDAIQT